jgi:hypothetical protein
MRPVVACALVAVTLAGVAAPVARAHGDPGSEYLTGHEVYVPFDLKAPSAREQQLVELVNEANRDGFSLRVALVWNRFDLGSRTVFWRKPQAYARYLEEDLRDAYKDRLLVVMPSGFGFTRLGHSTASERAALSKLSVEPGPASFVDSSLAAVRTLADASGVKLSGTPAAKPSSRSRDRVIIVIAVLMQRRSREVAV